MNTGRGRAASAPWFTWFLTFLFVIGGYRHTPHAAALAPAQVSSGVPGLQRTIDALLANPELARASWGVSVRSLTAGDVLYAANAHRLLIPASTAKVVTLAVAADRLGWDFRFRTQLMAMGTVTGGVLDGDLIVIGSGDPTFDDWDGAATRHFTEWAAALRNKGIRTVRGRIIGDDNVFDDEGLGAGWAWDDVTASYSGATSGLQFNQATAQLVITPANATGLPPRIDVRPEYVTLQMRNRAITSPAGSPLAIRPLPRSTDIEVTGTIPLNASPAVRNLSVPNPTLYFATAVREGLLRAGVNVEGAAIDVDDLPVAVPPTEVMLIAEVLSAPLSEFSRTMMLLSQNLFAETLLKTLAVRPDAAGTTAAGRTIVREVLTGWGLAADDVSLVDGSGLSRYNLLTPDAMVQILAHIYREPRLRDSFIATLPLAGVDGTVAGRMRNTDARSNARAKTGALSNARAIAGFVNSADGEPIAFSIMANNFNVRNEVVDRTSDAIIAALATLSRR